MQSSQTPLLLLEVLEADPVMLEQIAVMHRLESSPEAAYAHIRRAYMASDCDQLSKLVEAIEALGGQFEWPRLLGALRLDIRLCKVKSSAFEPALAHASDVLDSSLWRAEALHLCGVAYEIQGSDELSRLFYVDAYQLFAQHGAKLRAAISYHNSLAAESRVDPSKRLFVEYDRAYQLALAAGERATAGVSLNNLAREFQLLGALHAAIKRSNQAIKMLSETHFGSYQYFLALANRCDILLDLGLTDAALGDYDEVSCAQIPEIRGAAHVLFGRAHASGLSWRTLSDQSPMVILPTWLERRVPYTQAVPASKTVSFTEMESALLEALTEKPHSSVDLVERLYGKAGDFGAKENRLKQLLHRIKRKAPQLVCRMGPTYTLAPGLPGSPVS